MKEIKKYKLNRKLTEFYCAFCNELSDKPTSEYNRNLKKGRKNFCSRSCSIKYRNSLLKGQPVSEKRLEHLKNICNNRRDEFTPFRYTYRNAKKRFKEFDLELQDLADLWEEQKGICPYSKIKLKLPTYTDTLKDKVERASLDRIDSSKGYIKGNIQFIATNINYMKAQLSHDQFKTFLDTVVKNISSFNEDQTISSSSNIEESDALAGY